MVFILFTLFTERKKVSGRGVVLVDRAHARMRAKNATVTNRLQTFPKHGRKDKSAHDRL